MTPRNTRLAILAGLLAVLAGTLVVTKRQAELRDLQQEARASWVSDSVNAPARAALRAHLAKTVRLH
jgi:hypothetical protein